MKGFCQIHLEEHPYTKVPAVDRIFVPWMIREGLIPVCQECLDSVVQTHRDEYMYQIGYAHACGYSD